jgi:hypothetical protein
MVSIFRRSLLTVGVLLGLGALLLHGGPTRLHRSHLVSADGQPSFIWPIDGAPDSPYLVGDAFGPRRNAEIYDWHQGIDIKGEKCATEVIASTSGQVRISADHDSRYPGCGRIIQIQYPDLGAREYRTNYCHLCERRVDVGDYVEQGDVIGLVGDDMASWSHLHFETRNGDSPENPYCYLPHPDLNNHRIEISNVVTSSLPISISVSLRVTTPRDELDINEVRVRVLALDAGGVEVDNKYVNFNEKHNCGTDNECEADGSTQICIDPQHFRYDIPTWDVRFTFSGLSASSLVLVLAEAKDCGGVVKSATWNNLPKRVYLPVVTKHYESQQKNAAR